MTRAPAAGMCAPAMGKVRRAALAGYAMVRGNPRFTEQPLTVVPRSSRQAVESELAEALDVIEQCARRDPPLWSDQAHKDAALALLARHGRQR